MKSIKKILFIMAALAATLAFVSCSSDDDDPSTVAVYKGTEEGVATTITFYDDDTWNVVAEYQGKEVARMNGTYKGDPSKDNTTISVTIKKGTAMDENGNMVDIPLEDLEESSGEMPIIGGKLAGIYTRQ